MAIPNIDWDVWSQPSIEPFMEAAIHFNSGTVYIDDNDIASVNFTLAMFDNSHVLFGPPEPATGSLEIVDFAQRFNPVYNSELTEGILIELFLCAWPQDAISHLGNNIVTSFEQPIQVSYLEQDVWATIVHIDNDYLHPLHRYYIEYTYRVEDAYEEFTEWFSVPGEWFERHIYAIVQRNEYTITDVIIKEVLPYRQQYGAFYSTEWTYDTSGHSVTVEFVDSLDGLLLTDNRIDSLKPSINTDLQTFITNLITLYDSNLVNDLDESDTVELPYSFYEDTCATTINNGVEALGASLIYAHDGIPHLFDLFWYDTGVTLSDNDVETYSIMQSSIALYDSIEINAMVPARVFNQQLVSLENQYIQYPERLSFSVPRVYDAYSVEVYSEDGRANPPHAWNYTIKDIAWRRSDANQFYSKFIVLGSTIELTERSLDTVIGNVPYSIKSNGYIPTIEHAQVLYTKLAAHIFQKYFTIQLTFRGCYGFWVGAKIHISSTLYGINADYIIVGLSFVYNGAIHTDLVLQRIL